MQSVMLLSEVVARHSTCVVEDTRAALQTLCRHLSAIIINQVIWQVLNWLVNTCLMMLLISRDCIIIFGVCKVCPCRFLLPSFRLMAHFSTLEVFRTFSSCILPCVVDIKTQQAADEDQDELFCCVSYFAA